MARVLVTRPEPGASATAGRLAAMGHAPLILTLNRIQALEAVFPDPGEVDVVAVTSANALRHSGRGFPPAFLAKPCYAVGARSAEAARVTGFTRVVAGEGDGEALARLLTREQPAGTRILYVCGRVRRLEFERALRARGYRLMSVETYDSVVETPDAATLAALMGGSPVPFAVVYSPESAACLARVATGEATARFFEKTCFLCLSRAIAERLEGIAPDLRRWSETPTEDALLGLLPSA